MGQKVHPVGIRLGIVRNHSSVWYAEGKSYADQLYSDIRVREYIGGLLADASVSHIDIERLSQGAKAHTIFITIYSARPGMIIGKSGEDIEKMRAVIGKMLRAKAAEVKINIEEVRNPDSNASLVAQSVASQLERRIMFRRAMKRAVQNAMRAGALGVRVQVGGRLGGAEIARTEWYREGRVPLHTLRANIDYATARAMTTYGVIGIKTWVFHGEVIGGEMPEPRVQDKPRRPQDKPRRAQDKPRRRTKQA